jgi:hypothetical protein
MTYNVRGRHDYGKHCVAKRLRDGIRGMNIRALCITDTYFTLNWERTAGTYWIVGFVGPRADVDDMEEGKFLKLYFSFLLHVT